MIDNNHTVIYKDDNDNDFDVNYEHNNADNKKEKINSVESDLSDQLFLRALRHAARGLTFCALVRIC